MYTGKQNQQLAFYG